QPDDPGNDGHVGKVKNVPIEAEACGIDVKQHEIHHPTIGDAVDGVADRPADDEAEAQRGEPRGRARQANPQQNHGDRLECQQNPLSQRSLLREQAIADASIPGEVEHEKGCQRERAACPKIEFEQEPELDRLIDRRGRHGHRKREWGQRPPKQGRARTGRRVYGSVFRHHRYSAASRIASTSRSAWASRGETSGWAGSEPPLGRIFPERALFFPSGSRPSTATPLTSSRRNASGGPSPSTSVESDVMAISAK